MNMSEATELKGGWIGVDERKPMDDEKVFIHWADGTVSRGTYVSYPYGGNVFQHSDGTDEGSIGWTGIKQPKARHWMSNELPLPPV